MKRPLVKTDIFKLVSQGAKYRAATKEWYLANQDIDDLTGIEIYFLVGKDSKNKIYLAAEKSVIEGQLSSINAKILTYDELITKSNQAYAEYLAGRSEIKKIKQVIDAI